MCPTSNRSGGPTRPGADFGEDTRANDSGVRAPTPLPPLPQPPPRALGNTQTPEPVNPRVRRQRSMASTRAKTGRHRRAGLVDGRYELEEMISKGGMGRVFRARHRDLGRKVALKLVLDGFQEDQELRELFFKEARLASSLNHPNIINVTDFGLDDELGYFVAMDLLEGETLRERIRNKRPTLRFGFDVMDQICGALRYIHGRDIFHLDLKPENVFLSRVEGEPRRSNMVKLLDFGLSWRRESMPDAKLGGTPPYLAPERLRGAAPSALCDVYSLGTMLYELIAGELPYQGSVPQMMDRQLNGPPPPLPSKKAREAVDDRADELVMRALSRDPAKRPVSAEAFQFELRALMSMMGIPARRHVMMVDSSHSLDAEVAMQSVVESPVPLAIFDLSGAVKLANYAFIEAMEGIHVPIANFNELAVTRRHRDLHAAFQQAVEGKGPTSRVVLAGAEGGERSTILWIAPLVKDGIVSGVHMTVVLSGAGKT